MTNSVEVRVATPRDRDRVVETVVAAFDADPAFRYFFADPATFSASAATFAGHLFDKRVVSGTIWVIEDAAAVAMWEGPAPVPPTSTVPPASTVPPTSTVPLALPAAALARLNTYDAAVHDALPDEPHWYLGVLASHPSRAGLGLARTAMRPGLARAAADGLPAYLETTNLRNVELYRRSGWEVTAQRSVAELTVWVMAHKSTVDM